jgi:hypothetical protein
LNFWNEKRVLRFFFVLLTFVRKLILTPCTICVCNCTRSQHFYSKEVAFWSITTFLFFLNFNRTIFIQKKFVVRDRCCDFKNIFAEKFGESIGVFCSNYF